MIEQLSVGKVSDRVGKPGQVTSPPMLNDERAFPHTTGRATEVWTIGVDASPTVSTVYSVTILGETIEYTATGTQADDVDGLVSAINANPIMRGVFTATNTGPDTTVTLTANSYRVDLDTDDISVDDEGTAELTLAEDTAQADANQIIAGRAVYRDGSGGVTMTNPNSDLSALAGFARRLETAEQTGIASNDTDLYEADEDVAVCRTCRMIQSTGAAASNGDEIWIEQSAGDNLGKAYNASGNTVNQLTLTPSAVNDTTYSIDLRIVESDGTVYVAHAEYLSDGTATVAEITAGLTAALEAIDAGGLPITVTDNSTDLDIDFDDLDAEVSYTVDDNTSATRTQDGTRERLDGKLGSWYGPNEIEIRLGL